MSAPIPDPNRDLNRLRAAAALIPIIEAGLDDARMTSERAATMISFCESAAAQLPSGQEARRLKARIEAGLQRLKPQLVG